MEKTEGDATEPSGLPPPSLSSKWVCEEGNLVGNSLLPHGPGRGGAEG